MAITAGRRSVAPERIPTVTIPESVESPGISGALQEIGKSVTTLGKTELKLQQIEQQKTEKRDAALLKANLLKDKTEATNAFVTYQGSLNEKDNDIKKRKQLTAQGTALEFKTFSNEAFTKINETLTTPESQQLFFSDVQLHDLNKQQQANVYEREETEKGQESSFTNATTVSVETGVKDFKNPNTHGISEDHIEENARSLQELKGWSKDETDLFIADNTSRMYEAIIRKQMIDDPELGGFYFDVVKDKINTDRHDELNTLITKGQTNQKGKELSESIELQTDDFEEQKNLAKAHKDADVSDNALARIESNETDKLAKEKRDDEAIRDNIFGNIHKMAIDENVPLADMLDYANSTDNGKNNADFDKYARAQHKDINGVAREGDVDKFLILLEDIEAGKYNKASDLTGFYADLSLPQFNKALSNLEGKLSDDKTGAKKNEGDIKWSTTKEAFSAALGVKYDVEDKNQNKQINFVYDKLTEMGITDFGKAKDEIQKLILDGEIQGGLWDTNMTREEAEATGQMHKWIPNILTEDIDRGKEKKNIMDEFRKDGIMIYSELLARLYKKDTILELPLSEAEKVQYRFLWRRSKEISKGK